MHSTTILFIRYEYNKPTEQNVLVENVQSNEMILRYPLLFRTAELLCQYLPDGGIIECFD
jgi:hypothetical protein